MRFVRTLAVVLVGGLLGGCTAKTPSDSADGTEPGTGADSRAGGPGAGTPAGTFVPAPLALRVLTPSQYRNAIRDLLGAAAAGAVTPPAITSASGFEAVGAAQFALATGAVRQFADSAYLAAAAAIADPTMRTKVVPCAPKGPSDEVCMRTFITLFGGLAWRRPLAQNEIVSVLGVAKDAAVTLNDFFSGVEFAVATLLQAPDFLYQVEIGVPDPNAPAHMKLTGWEVATRLSFFLDGTTPPAALLSIAEKGGLDTESGIRTEAENILSRPGAKQAVGGFFDELLQLRDTPQVLKSQTLFPTFTPALTAAMGDETRRLIDAVVWEQNGDFRDVFDADYTYLNNDLATLYGISGAPATGFGKVMLPANDRRAGIFGHAAFLSLMAHPESTSPTFRGKFIRERVLCESIGKPPPNVDTSAPVLAGKTQKELYVERVKNPTCAACHSRMDPIGLGLENFDASGQYRETDQGQPIAAEPLDDVGTFVGARELGELLRNDPRVPSCVAKNLFRVATGHVDTDGEAASFEKIVGDFSASTFKLQQLAVAIAASDAFRYGARPQGVKP